jgi:hypothetical protein
MISVSNNINLVKDIYCSSTVNDTFTKEDFLYFDKDGFELNSAEQKFYQAEGHDLSQRILNHCSWQQSWLCLDENQNFLLDHSMILYRCSYRDAARQQILNLSVEYPYAKLLLQVKEKWGLDFALDADVNGEIIEILHIEWDTRNFNEFLDKKHSLEQQLVNFDWIDIRNKIYQQKDQWQCLRGFAQNHWKANYILGWTQAEFLEKA